MAGRRPLTQEEERALLRVVRKLHPRDRALVTAQWFTGFRISEILSLTIGDVFRNGQIRTKIGIAPKRLKGGYGRTRYVPVLPELGRALDSHLHRMGLKYLLNPRMPLFLSVRTQQGEIQAMTRSGAQRLLKRVMQRAGVEDDGRLGTHSLRKTFARAVYRSSGNDIMVLRAALGHSSVSISERYLEVDADEVEAAMRSVDFTRGGRRPVSLRPVRLAA